MRAIIDMAGMTRAEVDSATEKLMKLGIPIVWDDRQPKQRNRTPVVHDFEPVPVTELKPGDFIRIGYTKATVTKINATPKMIHGSVRLTGVTLDTGSEEKVLHPLIDMKWYRRTK